VQKSPIAQKCLHKGILVREGELLLTMVHANTFEGYRQVENNFGSYSSIGLGLLVSLDLISSKLLALASVLQIEIR